MNRLQVKRSTIVLFTIYLLFLVWAILFKFQLSFDKLPDLRSINWIPFGPSSYKKGKFNTIEVVSNFIIFIPFGLYWMMLSYRFSNFLKILLMAFVSLTFEIIQYFLSIGVSDVTDLLMNVIGGATGILLYFLLYKIFGKRKKVDIFLVFGTALGTAISIPLIFIFLVGQ